MRPSLFVFSLVFGDTTTNGTIVDTTYIAIEQIAHETAVCHVELTRLTCPIRH